MYLFEQIFEGQRKIGINRQLKCQKRKSNISFLVSQPQPDLPTLQITFKLCNYNYLNTILQFRKEMTSHDVK